MSPVKGISTDKMNRIHRRLRRLPSKEQTGVTVGKVLVEELGVVEANRYVEESLAEGTISVKEYNELKAAVVLHVPREQLPSSWAGRSRQELISTQRRIRKDASQLSNEGKEIIKAPLNALEKDVERIKRAWGV